MISQRGFDVVRDTEGGSISNTKDNILSGDKYSEHVNRQASKRSLGLSASAANLLYHKNTDVLAQLNESWNAHRFIHTSMSKEHQRLMKHNKTAKVDVYKMRQEALQMEFSRFFYECMNRIIICTIIAMSVIMVFSALLLQNKVNMWVAGPVIGLVCLIYICGLIIIIRKLSQRRIMDWQRFYWKKGDITDIQNACPDPKPTP